MSGNPLGKSPGDVWVFSNVKKTIHPCQCPVELVERVVRSLTNTGDKVFDPYRGVGTAVVGAALHGRVGYGCDIVPEYVDIARSRIRALNNGTLKTRRMNTPVYDPTKPNGGHRQSESDMQLFP